MSEPLSLLLSTPHGVWLFDSATESLRSVHRGRSEYYGISWNTNGIVLSHSLVDNTLPWGAGERYRDERFGVCVEYGDTGERSSPRVLLHPHQIECVGNRVLAANTGRNAIVLWHPASGGVGNTFLVSSQWDGIEPGSISLHVNSVHVQDDLLYAVAHNGNLLSAVWVYHWPRMELHTVFATRTRWAHNAWHSAHLAGLLICDSKGGALHSVDYDERVWATTTPATLTRGLAATESVVIVGLSEFTSRAERATSDGGLAILDRATLRTLVEYWFEGIGNVHEVRVISEQDACHTSVPPETAASAWIASQVAASEHTIRPSSKAKAAALASSQAMQILPSLPPVIEYDEGAGMSVTPIASGIVRIRTRRFGDSNFVVASLGADDCPAGALLRVGGWCSVESVSGEAYGLLRICFRDRQGEFLHEHEVRSDPAGFAEANNIWLDVACLRPALADLASVDILWLQTGPAEINLKRCSILVNSLPGALTRATEIATRLG